MSPSVLTAALTEVSQLADKILSECQDQQIQPTSKHAKQLADIVSRFTGVPCKHLPQVKTKQVFKILADRALFKKSLMDTTQCLILTLNEVSGHICFDITMHHTIDNGENEWGETIRLPLRWEVNQLD